MMARRLQYVLHLFIMGVILWQNCATTNPGNHKSNPQEKIEILKARLRTNPNDQQAFRDLGVIYFDLHQYLTARKCLTKAFKLKPNDPQTLFYLGMTLESEHKNNIALKVYKRYDSVPLLSAYRKKLAGRHQLLTRKMIRDEIQSLVKQEGQLGAVQLSPNAIAIFPLTYQGIDQQFAILGKGISEMMISDLSQVPGLMLIERIRLQALIDEIGLGQSGLVEESTAPRFGRFLRAGKILHGSYDVQNKNKLQMNMAFWDVVNQQAPNLASKNDLLHNLFNLEKDLVFHVVNEMGIELTAAEREKIQRIPTKNMQAFLNYCMGLEKEDANAFQAATQFYEKALQLDPNFTLASEKAEISKNISLGEQNSGQMLAMVDDKENTMSHPIANGNLINNRLQNLSFSIGSNFIPGKDSRKSLEEATSSGVVIYGDLPKPPALPNNRP